MALRPYQRAAVDSIFDFWGNGGGNPLVEMATGTGKSLSIGTLCKEAIDTYPDLRILNLVHVRELVEQDFKALLRVWKDAPAGVYSAGLGRRDGHHRITFGSIQSVYKKAAVLGRRDIVIVDEAHLVPTSGNGMYQTLFNRLRDIEPEMRICGFTATGYRLDSGLMCEGEDRLFDEVVFSYGIGAAIEDGWLSPLVSKLGATQIDVAGVARRGGEFVPGALEAAADVDAITASACREIVDTGRAQGRRSWLVFCTGIKHAIHVRDALRLLGVNAETITGETDPGTRERLIRQFRNGEIECLTNAQVLTTGFDAPGVDLLAFLRPTLSTSLYVQMAGRGTRIVWPIGFDPDAATAEERKDAIAGGPKPNCLVLDFASNVRRHGPVDMIEIKPKRAKEDREESDDVKVTVDTVKGKECPTCQTIVHVRIYECPSCGYAWPPPEPKHEAVADATPILSKDIKLVQELPVVSWHAQKHVKFGSPPTAKVSYFAGLSAHPEWICVEHGGPVADKAIAWWFKHGGARPAPATVDEFIERFDELLMPSSITIRKNDKWWNVVGRRFSRDERAAQ